MFSFDSFHSALIVSQVNLRAGKLIFTQRLRLGKRERFGTELRKFLLFCKVTRKVRGATFIFPLLAYEKSTKNKESKADSRGEQTTQLALLTNH